MNGFVRKNPYLSLCGLNCGLCPMLIGKYCPGCGMGEGNQSCKIARCSLEHGAVEYCCECGDYPCEKYGHIDDYDSFITHRHQRPDLERAMKMGIASYTREQKEKASILHYLLAHFNDGRKKTFFCTAVNLLAWTEIQKIMGQIAENGQALDSMNQKEKSAFVCGLFQNAAKESGVDLKLHRKK